MTTDDFINHDQDQDQSSTYADHSDDANETTSDVLLRLERLEKGNKTLSEQIKKQLKGRKPDMVDDDQEDDIETKIERKTNEIVTRQTWYTDNRNRIENLSEENRKIFEEESKVMSLEKALRLAEYNEPYRVVNNAGKYPRSPSMARNVNLNTEDPVDLQYRQAFGVRAETVKENKKALDELIGR